MDEPDMDNIPDPRSDNVINDFSNSESELDDFERYKSTYCHNREDQLTGILLIPPQRRRVFNSSVNTTICLPDPIFMNKDLRVVL
jgi:hypothetical protein